MKKIHNIQRYDTIELAHVIKMSPYTKYCFKLCIKIALLKYTLGTYMCASNGLDTSRPNIIYSVKECHEFLLLSLFTIMLLLS